VGRLAELARPFLVVVVTDATVEAAAATMADATQAGADAFELNLPALHREPDEAVRYLLEQTRPVVYTSCRRAGFMRVYGIDDAPPWNDEERMERQLAICAHGSAALDIELDAFDEPCARGVSTAQSAVDRQRDVAGRARAAGADVIYSCHSTLALNASAIVDTVELAAERGGTLAKIVTQADDELAAVEVLRGAVEASRRAPLPATVVASGAAGRFTRVVGPAIAGGWMLCRPDSGEHVFGEQPMLRNARRVRDELSELLAPPTTERAAV